MNCVSCCLMFYLQCPMSTTNYSQRETYSEIIYVSVTLNVKLYDNVSLELIHMKATTVSFAASI
jgi:hypothetical protein